MKLKNILFPVLTVFIPLFSQAQEIDLSRFLGKTGRLFLSTDGHTSTDTPCLVSQDASGVQIDAAESAPEGLVLWWARFNSSVGYDTTFDGDQTTYANGENVGASKLLCGFNSGNPAFVKTSLVPRSTSVEVRVRYVCLPFSESKLGQHISSATCQFE
jgi:hypothetical protein